MLVNSMVDKYSNNKERGSRQAQKQDIEAVAKEVAGATASFHITF